VSYDTVLQGTRTRLSLSVPGWFVMYAIRSPPGIQSKANRRGSVMIPKNGTMFGCAKCFHITANRWKLCGNCKRVIRMRYGGIESVPP